MGDAESGERFMNTMVSKGAAVALADIWCTSTIRTHYYFTWVDTSMKIACITHNSCSQADSLSVYGLPLFTAVYHFAVGGRLCRTPLSERHAEFQHSADFELLSRRKTKYMPHLEADHFM